MAITLDVTSVRQNYRGIYFEFVGDGAATAVTVPHAQFTRPGMNVTAIVVTAPTSVHSSDSRGGGHNFPIGGTPATVASAVVNSVAGAGGTITVTTSAAVGNGTRAYCNVVHAGQID